MSTFTPIRFDPKTDNEAAILASLDLIPIVLEDVREEIEAMIRQVQADVPPPADLEDAVILAPSSSGRNVIQPTGAAVVPFTIKGAASQTANLFQVQTSASVDRLMLTPEGAFRVGNSITVGTAFQARYNFSSNSTLVFQFENASQAGDGDHSVLLVSVTTNSTTAGNGAGSPVLLLRRGVSGNKEWSMYFNKSDDSLRWKYNNSGSSTDFNATSLMFLSSSGNLTLSRASAGGQVICTVENTDASGTSGSQARLLLKLGGRTATFRYGGGTQPDFNIETSDCTNLIHFSYAANSVGFRTSSPSYSFDFNAADVSTGTLAVRNAFGGASGRIESTDNASTSHATLNLYVHGVGGGDPKAVFEIPSGVTWAIGADNSDSDSLVVSESGVLGTNNRLKIHAGGNVEFYKDLILPTVTGTKIGTSSSQLLGFWNATPVAQYSTTGTVTGFTAGAGTAVLHDSTFTGNTGSAAYTMGDIIRALKLCGIIAA